MRRMFMLVLLAAALGCVGCDKRHNVSDFSFKPGLTTEQVADMAGSPSRIAPHQMVYNLTDGTELRIYFLDGPRDGTRTLTRADIFTKEGELLKNVYLVPQPMPIAVSAPATQAATQP